MPALKKPIPIQTTFAEYELRELLGEGGAGRVYAGTSDNGDPVAVKLLINPARDKRQRFKNEIAFQQRTKHPNIVPVLDHGVSTTTAAKGPFYIMPRYDGSLREIIERGIRPDHVMALASQIFNGVEAAHLKSVQHRDLKPENILHSENGRALAIADFGIARFTEQELSTMVDTDPQQRLANFVYAAPEQRQQAGQVGIPADIYALGLMLNEMFTGMVPHGTDYRSIASVSAAHGYLDPIVAQMIKQNPGERPASIDVVKMMIQKYEAEAVARQKISQIDATVIKQGEIDEPLAYNEVKVIGVNYDGQNLVLTLSAIVSQEWIRAFQNMGGYQSVVGADPRQFQFRQNLAVLPYSVRNSGGNALQMIVDFFKSWMPNVTRSLKTRLEEDARKLEAARRNQLAAERQREEELLRINSSLRV